MKTETFGAATLTILSPREVAERLEHGGVMLVDVRTPAEFAFERIGTGVNVPLESFSPAQLGPLAGTQVIFHCGSGKRSAMVAERCFTAGWTETAHMEGGLAAWKAAGLPTLAINPATGGLRETGGT